MRYKRPVVTLYIVAAQRPQNIEIYSELYPTPVRAEAHDFAKSINLIKARVDNSGYAGRVCSRKMNARNRRARARGRLCVLSELHP